MKENNIYLPFNPLSEVIAVPFLVSRIFKGKKIKDLIDEKIDLAREKSAKINLTEIDRVEKELEYDNLDNFFVKNFRALDNSIAHSFDDKITYCLDQYSKESRKIFTASNLVVLEENFLKGAEKTLLLYFSLFEKNDEVIVVNEEDILLNEEIIKVDEEDSITNDTIIRHTYLETNKVTNLENSLTLKEFFKDQELFSKIEFSRLKEQDVIFIKNVDDFIFRKRAARDIFILVIYLSEIKFINIEHGNNYQDKLLEILSEIGVKQVGKSIISRIYNGIVHESGGLSKPDLATLQEIKLFIDNISKCYK